MKSKIAALIITGFMFMNGYSQAETLPSNSNGPITKEEYLRHSNELKKPIIHLKSLKDTDFVILAKDEKAYDFFYSFVPSTNSVISYRAREPKDIYEFYCFSISAKDQVTVNQVCVKEDVAKDSLVDLKKAFKMDLSKHTDANLSEQVKTIILPKNMKLAKVGIDIKQDEKVIPIITTMPKKSTDIEQTYSFMRINSKTDQWNGQQVFIFQENFDPK